MHRKIDLLIFNPPYVPTEDEEAYGAQSGHDIEGSWAGGKDGMQVTDILLNELGVRDVCFRPHDKALTSCSELAVSRRPFLSCRCEGQRCSGDPRSSVAAARNSKRSKTTTICLRHDVNIALRLFYSVVLGGSIFLSYALCDSVWT